MKTIKVKVGERYHFLSMGITVEIEVTEITDSNTECRGKFIRMVGFCVERFQMLAAIQDLITQSTIVPIQFSMIQNIKK